MTIRPTAVWPSLPLKSQMLVSRSTLGPFAMALAFSEEMRIDRSHARRVVNLEKLCVLNHGSNGRLGQMIYVCIRVSTKTDESNSISTC
jgi:hypothetical protein